MKVLIAEDEMMNFEYLRAALKPTQVKIIRANNGKEAIDLLEQNPDIALILMDIKMPILNGIDATREIRKTNTKIPIIAQTAYAYRDDKYEILQAGCNEYLAKPIKPQLLLDTLSKYLLS